MGPNRLPSFVYLTPCIQMNYWVVLLLLYLVWGLIRYMNYDHALLVANGFFIDHDNIILLIGTWCLT
jgi:hypothetical protein